MTFVVPFDGSTATEAALTRARDFGDALDEAVRVISIIPSNNARYARQRGWLASDEPFDVERIAATLSTQVEEIAPDASFTYERCSRDATANSISKPIRKFAKRHDASTVFVGSDNAGRIVTTVGSVGGRISADGAYDILIVRSG